MPNSISAIILVLLYYCQTRKDSKEYYRMDELLKEFDIRLEVKLVENHLDILLKDGCLLIPDVGDQWLQCHMQLTPKGINRVEDNPWIVEFAKENAKSEGFDKICTIISGMLRTK